MRTSLMLGAATIALALAAPGFAQDRTAPGSPGTSPPSQADRRADDAAKQRAERLKSAQPAEKAAVSADALMGTEVRNTNDQKIGTVKDLVMKEGKITSIIVARGGVLGMGTDYHQVELAQVKVTSDMETVVLDLSEEQVKALPKMAFEKGQWGPAPVAEKSSPPSSTAPGAPPSRTTPAEKAPAEKAPADKPAAPKNQ